ncbi:hypothetical protein D0T53_10405 [Dysgonomonas sp. 216]|uniref:hypothetical protein n=1 Tax=Dysgonomonas sp. 216 TaxID=2302934 RepID=UPI0013D32D0A|nr:hypothetical protein [Dysgonomonas sp. 216]NDW19320.1 hypothetical protein [Dysgonomonas sp. 216]
MIQSVINIFRQQAREHKLIKSFCYNRNYELGNGNENHPLFWLEDPILGRNQSNLFVNSVNFSILFVPSDEDDILSLQNLAFSTGLNILERIKLENTNVGILPTWTFLTLRDYYDNNACGCRFSVDFTQLNMQNLCLIGEQFDENKQFETEAILDNFEVFIDKLPVFDIKISK